MPTVVPVLKEKPEPLIIQRPEGIDQMDWSALHTTVSSCQACTLCSTRNNTVFGVGAPAVEGHAPQVDWLIVGEAPGENEDQQGEPFVGQAGKLLDNMLSAMKLSRTGERTPEGGGVFIANVLKCRPPGNRNPKPEEVAQCLPYLERQVALLKPKMILAMGRFAVQALLRDSVPEVESTPLGKLRGRVYQYQNLPVVVTYHPAYVLRNLPEKAKVWADLCLAMGHVKGAE
jgi:DNA polymerase